ncbi:energy-coupling factor transporter transmembrane component T family protein [Anaerobacillus isosaccharinicus]|uniref:Energy-coupling factor transporter transmembrane protein EcfT n=1 Tax=Anaerobacillus isosaccharinicus TaxID=1532552 RepID=A0A1S2MF88_9BACI|nr:energy-coupling factor transporter transmembrane component T [Anaerobacillus isosaccharinicus]MBA5584026.1 energy-coupling factor transporter transmembrane protein EcfT [Anaerobacillus isosaccharinicus]QOY37559.1 energy-coupling factor transporter transmembrane protein EcfT [Anaerobacillus isosaccharinicus]
MLQNIIIGQYVSGDSVIHNLDARSKLTAIFFFVIIVFLANNWLTYALLFITVLIAIYSSRVSPRYIYKGMKPIFFLVILMFILHGLMTKEGEILFSIGWFEVYLGGIIQGLFIALRLLLLIMMTTLLTLTTAPIQLTDGLENIFGPLRKINVPVHELALMMSISLRFIPTLLQETEKIMKAQMARGVDFTGGSISNRVKAIIPLLVPLFMQSFRRAEDLAIAMEARGYRGGEGRTRLRELEWTMKDSVAVAIVIVLGFMLFMLRS